MSIFSKALIGSAGLAMSLAAAAPAAAQYYPQPQPYNNGGNNGGVVGAIINSVTGAYGQYPQGNYGYGVVSQRTQVAQCAAATEQRLNGGYAGQGYGGYNGNYPQQQGYGYNGYANQGARVVGITNVERRGNGALRVTGVASSNAYANQAYNQGYNRGRYAQQGYANQQADVRFTCKVNSRGQVTDVNVNRLAQSAYRGY